MTSLLSTPVTPFTFLAIFSTFALSLSLDDLAGKHHHSVVGIHLNRLSAHFGIVRDLDADLIHDDIVGNRRLVLVGEQRRQDQSKQNGKR